MQSIACLRQRDQFRRCLASLMVADEEPGPASQNRVLQRDLVRTFLQLLTPDAETRLPPIQDLNSIASSIEKDEQANGSCLSSDSVRATNPWKLWWTIEQDFQAGKGECGLDEYETRGWTGWHHHTALSMLALFFLMLQRRRVEKKNSR